MVIEKNRRTNKYVVVDRELTAEERAKKRKLIFALQMRELEAAKQHELEHREGYCPHCHMLIPLNGVCDCGYTRR